MEKEHKSHKHHDNSKQEEKHHNRYVDAKGNPIQFSLWCNERVHKIPVNSMIRVSKRCLSLAKSNYFQGSIVHPVSESALTAFLLACELKPFKVTASNAIELLELSQEWGIRSLESFVNQYINQKGIKQSSKTDHLGNLLSTLEDDEADNSNEIRDVARNFDKYLLDERLADVHPEHLFKILSQAEVRAIDQQKLTDFIMSLFESNPEKAVPLSLKANFEYLDNNQIETIFQTREFHRQSMGYFAAKALSDFRNRYAAMLANIDVKYLREMQEIRDHIIKRRTIKLTNFEQPFPSQIKDLHKVVAVQQKQINQLRKIQDTQKKAMAAALKSYKSKKEQLDKEFKRIEAIVNEVHGTQNDRFSVISSQINEGVAPITKQTIQTLAGLVSRNYHRRELMKKGLEERRGRLVQNCEDVTANAGNVSLLLQNVQDRIQDTRATFASKIIKDQLRQDSFLRDITNQFSLFDIEPRFWELNSDQVKLAHERVNKMESKVRESCPTGTKKRISQRH